jgi:hypothetical protein
MLLRSATNLHQFAIAVSIGARARAIVIEEAITAPSIGSWWATRYAPSRSTADCNIRRVTLDSPASGLITSDESSMPTGYTALSRQYLKAATMAEIGVCGRGVEGDKRRIKAGSGVRRWVLLPRGAGAACRLGQRMIARHCGPFERYHARKIRKIGASPLAQGLLPVAQQRREKIAQDHARPGLDLHRHCHAG